MMMLSPGQNLAWPDQRATVYVEHAAALALVVDRDYRGRVPADVVGEHSGTAVQAGVSWLPGDPEGITVDLAALRADGAAHVLVLASGRTLAQRPPVAHLLDTAGTTLATVTADELTAETAVVLTELYLHHDAWKVRAVGRGYDGGIAAAAAAHGLSVPAVHGPAVHGPAVHGPAVHGPAAYGAAASAGQTAGQAQQPGPVQGQGTGQAPSQASGGPDEEPDEDRMLQLVGMILDDASRTTASRRSSVAFAEQRLESDIEQVVADPAMRIGPAGEQARAAAASRRDDLVRQADEAHRRDVAQLVAELDDLERRFPPSMARWDSGRWASFAPTDPPSYAIRAGELSLEEAPQLRLPMMLRLPLSRQLWVDPEPSGDAAATQVMAVLALRLACAMAPIGARVRLIDIGGRRGTLGFPPELLAGPPVTDAGGAGEVLRAATERNDVLQVAVDADAADSLTAEQTVPWILMCPDVPTGLDESSVQALLRLTTQQAGMGVQLLLSGAAPAALGVPILETIYDSCLRLPSGPGGDLVDAFGGVDWVFVPDQGPPQEVAGRLFARFAADPTRQQGG